MLMCASLISVSSFAFGMDFFIIFRCYLYRSTAINRLTLTLLTEKNYTKITKY